MLQKITKFVKENVVAVVGIVAIVVSFLLMLLPGQFADLHTSQQEIDKLNGYEFLFNSFFRDGKWMYWNVTSKTLLFGTGEVLTSAIFIIVLASLSIIGYVLNKKSSAIMLLVTLLMVALSVFFFAMEANAINVYGIYKNNGAVINPQILPVVKWVSYFDGALILLAAAFTGYKTVLTMKDEIKRPASAKANTYSYLKK